MQRNNVGLLPYLAGLRIAQAERLKFRRGCGSKPITLQPKPSMIFANTQPILPVPTTATVLPQRSKPVSPSSEKF